MSEAWGGYDRNIDYNPEACGLRIVGKLEDAQSCYSFDEVLVVQDIETGKLYAAHDEGCSCPTPFEGVRSLADMTEIRSVADIQAFVKAQYYGDREAHWSQADKQALYKKVQDALRG